MTSTSPDARRICDLGYAALEAGRFGEARRLFEQARTAAPDDPLVHFRMALLAVDTGDPAGALVALDRSLALDPGNARACNNRGSALQLLGSLDEAEHAFRRAIDLDGDLAQPYSNLAHILTTRGKTDEAVALYKRALARGVEPERFGHEVAILLGSSRERAPDDWVRATFDNFAPTFDTHLTELGYDAPRQLAAMIEGNVTGPSDIVDLGCGTGQCGIALAKLKRHVTGIDLSPKMLALAQARGVYDELHAGEIGTWLASAPADSADIVIAGDIFIYVGALESVFEGIARILRPSGWLAFSTEEVETGDYTLLGTGRFAQSRSYINRLAESEFVVHAADPAVIRTESGRAVLGRLYLLRKT